MRGADPAASRSRTRLRRTAARPRSGEVTDLFVRADILGEVDLPDGRELAAEGAKLARDWTVGPCPFLREFAVACEADYKRSQIEAGRVMRHAQLGYRDIDRSRRAYAEIHEACLAHGARIDRYGLCLDWSMGYRTADRAGRQQGTGMILNDVEDFVALTQEAPVAPHFGDFVLGFPAALENTQAALAAGATVIGNLGQYFTFRLPGWSDDLDSAAATVRALGLIGAQSVEVLVHSNLDDGFAAQFADLSCALGAALLESHIVEGLLGVPLSHCFGHHFSDPPTRLAFLRALQQVGTRPGTMLYGNTVSYRGGATENFASLASYLLVDILGQRAAPSGHAVNPVPVSENRRIPDIEEIVQAQLYAERLNTHAEGFRSLLDVEAVEPTVQTLLDGAARFKQAVLDRLAEAGVRTDDPLELMLALRRLGARRLEAAFGPGEPDAAAVRDRRPLVPASTVAELDAAAAAYLARFPATERAAVAEAGLAVVTAATDVHEHGKALLDKMLGGLGVRVIDGGVSVDPEALAAQAATCGADAVAVSTYNGLALSYLRRLNRELRARGANVPVLVGGRLNEIPAGSNTSLPTDVSATLENEGARVCGGMEQVLPALLDVARERS